MNSWLIGSYSIQRFLSNSRLESNHVHLSQSKSPLVCIIFLYHTLYLPSCHLPNTSTNKQDIQGLIDISSFVYSVCNRLSRTSYIVNISLKNTANKQHLQSVEQHLLADGSTYLSCFLNNPHPTYQQSALPIPQPEEIWKYPKLLTQPTQTNERTSASEGSDADR